MTYKKILHGYAMWQETLALPMKRKPGEKQRYFFKGIPFEEAEKYWEYICEDGTWNIYYVRRGKDRRLAQANVGAFSPTSIMARIKDKDISVSDCRKIEEAHGRQVSRTELVGVIWAVDFDNKSVFDLMEQWPKMPYAHIKMVVAGEGGYIDDDGIIHRGTASYKLK